MTLLARHRRYLGILVAGFFGLVFLTNFIPDPLGMWQPRKPVQPEWGFMKRLKVSFDNLPRFVQDNFGFRASLPVLRKAVRTAIDAPDSYPIYAGQNGHLFWARDQTPQQSAGAVVRAAGVERFAAMIGEMQRQLAPLGTRVVVALPPNAQSVEVEALPVWTRFLDYPTTEYDLALQALRAEGVTAADLRSALRAGPRPRYLLTDTHWNNRSAILAFNAMAAAAGHPDWQLDPSEVIGLPHSAPHGDLLATQRARITVPDVDFDVHLKQRAGSPRPDAVLQHHNVHPEFASYVRDYAATGARVLIVGDSFTIGLWPQLFIHADVSVVGWMHASRVPAGACDFNFTDVARFRPDLLIYARTERFLICPDNAWPTGLPRPDPNAIPAGAAP